MPGCEKQGLQVGEPHVAVQWGEGKTPRVLGLRAGVWLFCREKGPQQGHRPRLALLNKRQKHTHRCAERYQAQKMHQSNIIFHPLEETLGSLS